MDNKFMQMVIDLAKKGEGFVSPNPMVGCIIVKDNRIISTGYHAKYGGFHAERNAILNASESLIGSTLYVNLEPCSHFGKTPPCTDIIIQSGIKKVVVGNLDPNPLVAGTGIKKLRANNIEVVVGILEDECKSLNEVFLYYISTKMPYLVMKYAMTMDGKIATKSGKSKWITSDISRQKVHMDRARYSSIMVGVNTVVLDNPLLTCRTNSFKNPIRIICDTNLRTPIDSQIVQTSKTVPTIIATASDNTDKINSYENLGCEILKVPLDGSVISFKELLIKLGEKNIDSILLEGGSTLNYSALSSGLVNKLQVYIAPKIFGGIAKSPVGGFGIDNPNSSFLVNNSKITNLGEDILIESDVINCLQE